MEKCHKKQGKLAAAFCDLPKSLSSALKMTPPLRIRPMFVKVTEDGNFEEQLRKEFYTTVPAEVLHLKVLLHAKSTYEYTTGNCSESLEFSPDPLQLKEKCEVSPAFQSFFNSVDKKAVIAHDGGGNRAAILPSTSLHKLPVLWCFAIKSLVSIG